MPASLAVCTPIVTSMPNILAYATGGAAWGKFDFGVTKTPRRARTDASQSAVVFIVVKEPVTGCPNKKVVQPCVNDPVARVQSQSNSIPATKIGVTSWEGASNGW